MKFKDWLKEYRPQLESIKLDNSKKRRLQKSKHIKPLVRQTRVYT
jgi:hypothetical protein